MSFLGSGVWQIAKILGRKLPPGDRSQEGPPWAPDDSNLGGRKRQAAENEAIISALEGLRSGEGSLGSLLDELASARYPVTGATSAATFEQLNSCERVEELLGYLAHAHNTCFGASRDLAAVRRSQAASALLVTGPAALRELIAEYDETLDVLLDYFTAEDGLDPRITANVCAVLAALLRDAPLPLLRRMAFRGHDVHALVRHIHHSCIAELLVRLLGVQRPQGHAAPGAGEHLESYSESDDVFVNALPVLSNARVFDLLAAKFVECAEYAEVTDESFYQSETLDNAETCFDAGHVARPVYSFLWLVVRLRANSTRYRNNVAMRQLDVLREPSSIETILNAGITSAQFDPQAGVLQRGVWMFRGILGACGADCGMCPADEDGQPSQQGSSKTRIEALVTARAPALLCVLGEAIDSEPEYAPPLGLSRFEIANFFATLMQTCTKGLQIELVALGVVDTLFELSVMYAESSMLHGCLVRVVDALLVRGAPAVQKWLLFDFSVVDWVLDTWHRRGDLQICVRLWHAGLGCRRRQDKRGEGGSYRCAVAQIGILVYEALEDARLNPGPEDLLSLLPAATTCEFQKFLAEALQLGPDLTS